MPKQRTIEAERWSDEAVMGYVERNLAIIVNYFFAGNLEAFQLFLQSVGVDGVWINKFFAQSNFDEHLLYKYVLRHKKNFETLWINGVRRTAIPEILGFKASKFSGVSVQAKLIDQKSFTPTKKMEAYLGTDYRQVLVHVYVPTIKHFAPLMGVNEELWSRFERMLGLGETKTREAVEQQRLKLPRPLPVPSQEPEPEQEPGQEQETTPGPGQGQGTGTTEGEPALIAEFNKAFGVTDDD